VSLCGRRCVYICYYMFSDAFRDQRQRPSVLTWRKNISGCIGHHASASCTELLPCTLATCTEEVFSLCYACDMCTEPGMLLWQRLICDIDALAVVCYVDETYFRNYRLTLCNLYAQWSHIASASEWWLVFATSLVLITDFATFLVLLCVESGVFLETKVYFPNGERQNSQQSNNFSYFHIFFLEMRRPWAMGSIFFLKKESVKTTLHHYERNGKHGMRWEPGHAVRRRASHWSRDLMPHRTRDGCLIWFWFWGLTFTQLPL